MGHQIAICYTDDEFRIKRISIVKDCCWLNPANNGYKPAKVTIENDFQIWGIVPHVIKAV